MKTWIWITGILLLAAGCGLAVRQATSDFVPELESLGPAPELSNEVWLNTDQPLRLADLRGQVVLLEMWTFG